MTDNRQQLIARLDQARQEMNQAIAEIPPDMEIYSGWTVKELISHIAGWDDAVIASFLAHTGGEAPGTPAARGINYYNSQTVLERNSLTLEHILNEWQATRLQLRKIILEMPLERFETPLVLPWGPTDTIESVCNIFIEHELEHAHDVRQVLKDEKKNLLGG
jgi:hypothetical protein